MFHPELLKSLEVGICVRKLLKMPDLVHLLKSKELCYSIIASFFEQLFEGGDPSDLVDFLERVLDGHENFISKLERVDAPKTETEDVSYDNMYASMYGGLNQIPEDQEPDDQEPDTEVPEDQEKDSEEEDIGEPKAKRQKTDHQPPLSSDFFEPYLTSFAVVSKLSDIFGHSIGRVKALMPKVWAAIKEQVYVVDQAVCGSAFEIFQSHQSTATYVNSGIAAKVQDPAGFGGASAQAVCRRVRHALQGRTSQACCSAAKSILRQLRSHQT